MNYPEKVGKHPIFVIDTSIQRFAERYLGLDGSVHWFFTTNTRPDRGSIQRILSQVTLR